jgi:2',3'-cyclic-nucleotide 2'-phosphodiesterase (5'-nucleotidase family)
VIKQQQSQFEHLLVLDAGDSLIKDRTPAISSSGKSSIDSMNLMGYDAMALGEGDLAQLGVKAIRQRMEEASFPFLSANVYVTETGELLAQPYLVQEMGGQRVAIIGLTGMAQVPGIEIRDPLATVREIVDQVRPRADILILLSHAGLETNRQIAREVPEIHVIISGGGQVLTSSPDALVDGPPVVHADVPSPGHAGRRIGLGVWSFDDSGKLVEQRWQNLALTPEIADDQAMLQWVSQNP